MAITLERIKLGNGRVTYVNEVEARPETREESIQKGVTVNIINAEIPCQPAHYTVSFMLQAEFVSDEGLNISNVFHWECIVPDETDRAEYRSVEDRAARQIAPMLRSLAEKIEADLPSFEALPNGKLAQ